MKCLLFILFLSLTSAVLADINIDNDIEASKDSVGIPGLYTTGLPISEAKEIFKKKCINEGHLKVYEKVPVASENLQKCFQNLIDVEVMKKEIEDAKPNGELDIVFKKYCEKSLLVKECISKFTHVIEPCFNEKERANIKLAFNIAENVIDFSCYRGGDRIALFVAEDGPKCFSDIGAGFQNCVNVTMIKFISAEAPCNNNLPELSFNSEQCDDMVKMQDCIVNELEKCDQPTTANLVESLFQFIKRATPCGAKKGKVIIRLESIPEDP